MGAEPPGPSGVGAGRRVRLRTGRSSQGEHSVVTHQVQRELMVQVTALAAHVLRLLGALLGGFRSPLAPPLAAAELRVRPLQLALRGAEVARMVSGLPRCPHQEDLPPPVDARLPAREPERG